MRQLTGLIDCEGDGLVCLCPEPDIASHGDSNEEARATMFEAVELFFETTGDSGVKTGLRGDIRVTPREVTVDWHHATPEIAAGSRRAFNEAVH